MCFCFCFISVDTSSIGWWKLEAYKLQFLLYNNSEKLMSPPYTVTESDAIFETEMDKGWFSQKDRNGSSVYKHTNKKLVFEVFCFISTNKLP